MPGHFEDLPSILDVHPTPSREDDLPSLLDPPKLSEAERDTTKRLSDEEYAGMHSLQAWWKGVTENFTGSWLQATEDAKNAFTREGLETVWRFLYEISPTNVDQTALTGRPLNEQVASQLVDDYVGILPFTSEDATIRANKKLHTDPVGSSSDIIGTMAMAIPGAGALKTTSIGTKVAKIPTIAKTAQIGEKAMKVVAGGKKRQMAGKVLGATAEGVLDPASLAGRGVGKATGSVIKRLPGARHKTTPGDILQEMEAVQLDEVGIRLNDARNVDNLSSSPEMIRYLNDNANTPNVDLIAGELAIRADDAQLPRVQEFVRKYSQPIHASDIVTTLLNDKKYSDFDVAEIVGLIHDDSVKKIFRAEVLRQIIEDVTENWTPDGLEKRLDKIEAISEDRIDALFEFNQGRGDMSGVLRGWADVSKTLKEPGAWIRRISRIPLLSMLLGDVGSVPGAGMVGTGMRQAKDLLPEAIDSVIDKVSKGKYRRYDTQQWAESLARRTSKAGAVAGKVSRKAGETERIKPARRSQASLPPGRILDLITNVH